MRRSRAIFSAVILLVAAACQTSDGVFEDGPRLVNEVTLAPVTQAPTRALSPTPPPATEAPTPTDEPTDLPPVVTMTTERLIAITPTLPPTKTPTTTPTMTTTPVPTSTPQPTIDVTPQEPILVPTMVFVTPPSVEVAMAPDPVQATSQGSLSLPLPGLPDVPAAQCSIPWFFNQPRLPDCPLSAPLESQAAHMHFQYGAMIWVGAQDAIYVIYYSAALPRWQVFPDNFEDGMPESDPALDSQAPDYADWQPRRGFGLIWRTQPGVLQRIGWSESPYEQQYTVRMQTRTDGTIFISEPNGRHFGLAQDGEWRLYDG